jgi:hypothetical protein
MYNKLENDSLRFRRWEEKIAECCKCASGDKVITSNRHKKKKKIIALREERSDLMYKM